MFTTIETTDPIDSQAEDTVSATVIELDRDTDNQESGDGISANGLYPYDPTYKSIEIDELPYSIFEYLRQLDKGKIIIQPDFQRNQVWSMVQKSQFIESIILNFPIPPIYLNQNKEDKFIVIDGLQRTTALADFFKDKFALSGLEAVPNYNGMTFSMLPETLQSKLEDKKITIFSLKPSTPLTVIYDLFKRINTGGTQLNRQEIRNCIFNGKSTRLLAELAAMKVFRDAIDNGVSPKRMKDREVVLRYLAFRWLDMENSYAGDLSNFVERMMRKLNSASDEWLDEIRADFIRTMQWCHRIWKRDSFRIPTESTRGLVNTAVLESVGKFISSCSDEFLSQHESTIRTNFKKLIENDEYVRSVTRGTGTKANVSTRFAVANEILGNVSSFL